MAGLLKFQLLHGGVLTQLLRKENPITLTMIETHPKDEWSTYRVSLHRSTGDERLLIQYSTNAKAHKRSKVTSWAFAFSVQQLKQIHEGHKEGHRVHVALICVRGSIDEALDRPASSIPVCLITNDKLKKITGQGIQSITVRHEPGKRLSVVASGQLLFKVPQNALERFSGGN